MGDPDGSERHLKVAGETSVRGSTLFVLRNVRLLKGAGRIEARLFYKAPGFRLSL